MLAVELCQHPVTGGHGEVAAWPVGGPSPVTHGAAAPGALTILLLFAQPVQVLPARGSWVLFAERLERLE